MKPSLAIFTYVKIERLKTDHSVARSKIRNSGHGTQIPLSHPLCVFTIWVLLLLLPVAASSQTTLIAVRDSQSVVLAADSKMVPSTVPFCKIRPCGSGFLAVSGVVEADAQDKQLRLWPVLMDVCKGHADPKQGVTMLEQASLAWLNGLIEIAQRTMPLDEYNKVKSEMSISFALVGWKGNSYIFTREVRLSNGSADSVMASRNNYDFPIAKNLIQHVFLGHFEGIQKFGGTPFSKLGLIKGSRFLINSMIRERPQDVGPPIDILRITKGRAEWIQRKPECEEAKKDQPSTPKPKHPPKRRHPRH